MERCVAHIRRFNQWRKNNLRLPQRASAKSKININLTNGGRIENDGKMIFGELDYFAAQGGSNNGHSDGIQVAMTINNGALDLTGGGYPDYPFGLISGDLVFGYEWLEGTSRSKNEQYSINFTGPGSITVDPHFDADAGQYLGGIYAVKQDSTAPTIHLEAVRIYSLRLGTKTCGTWAFFKLMARVG